MSDRSRCSAFSLLVVALLAASSDARATAARLLRGQSNSFARITALEIRNDTAIGRVNELAFSGVPIGRTAHLTSVDSLRVAAPDGQVVAAQFSVLSRWGGPPERRELPIRWLMVALQATVAANSTAHFELRRYQTSAPNPPEPSDIAIRSERALHTVDTGAASFVLDPSTPGLIQAIHRNGETIYRDASGAGPRVVDGGGAALRARPDPGSFAIEEAGPVKVVASVRGHFLRVSDECGNNLGYSARLTFERASSDVTLQWQVVNECGDGHTPAGRLPNGAPWWNRRYRVNEVAWNFPMQLGERWSTLGGGNPARIHRIDGQPAELVVEQERGRRGPVYRSARITKNGSAVEAAAAFEGPFVAVSGPRHAALLQAPWMRYREPQALVARSSSVAFQLISGPAIIGEAQGVWGFARLTIVDSSREDSTLRSAIERGRVALERGLLVHVPVEYLDATRVMPPLAPAGHDRARRLYQTALARVHEDTVRRGGQWERRKLFGYAVWPDYAADEDVGSLDETGDASPSSNYWSATTSEFKQWFVDGDPKWVWDFALPQEYTQLFSNYYNLGTRNAGVTTNYRGGFTPASGSRAIEGETYRSGWGSDDYTYNQGSDEAYLIRPSGSMLDRFADAADTFIRRYGPANIAIGQQRRRDAGLQALAIGRAQAQHVNFLSYAAQFSPTAGGRASQHLVSVMDEYIADNLTGGVFCSADFDNGRSCVAAHGLFHFTALQVGTFVDYLYWEGADDPRGKGILRAIATTADLYQRVLMRAAPDGRIDPAGAWYGVLECTFRDAGSTIDVCRGAAAEEPVYAHERPGALAFLMLAAHLAPNPPLCNAASSALPDALAAGLQYLETGAGWNKGAAQSAHLVVHALAIGPCS